MVKNMTFLKQTGGSNECWFACTMMVLLHFGAIANKSYADLKEAFRHEKVSDPVLGEGETEIEQLYATGGSETTIIELLNKRGINTQMLFRGNLAQQFDGAVRGALGAGKPVILGLNRGAGGHFVVAVDISGDDYIVFDPLANAPGTTLSINDVNIGTAIIIS